MKGARAFFYGGENVRDKSRSERERRKKLCSATTGVRGR